MRLFALVSVSLKLKSANCSRKQLYNGTFELIPALVNSLLCPTAIAATQSHQLDTSIKRLIVSSVKLMPCEGGEACLEMEIKWCELSFQSNEVQ